jgi:enamine deaminase RidA (YjgF/YER057c/UK114 family)
VIASAPHGYTTDDQNKTFLGGNVMATIREVLRGGRLRPGDLQSGHEGHAGPDDPVPVGTGRLRRRRQRCLSRRLQGQARGAYEAIKALVESQGGTMANIVKVTTYLTDMRYRVDLPPLREEFFGKKGPASTLIEISALAHPDWMIEIEAIAVI